MICKTRRLMILQVCYTCCMLVLSENVTFHLLGSSTQREAVPVTTGREGNFQCFKCINTYYVFPMHECTAYRLYCNMCNDAVYNIH